MAPARRQNSAIRAVAVIAAVSALIAIVAGIAARAPTDDDASDSRGSTTAARATSATTTSTAPTTEVSIATTALQGSRVTQTQVLSAKARWEALGIDDYEFTLDFDATELGPIVGRITVIDGIAVRLDGKPFDAGGRLATIDGLLAQAATLPEGAPFSATGSLDKRGIPTEYSVSYSLGQGGGSRSVNWTVTDFRSL